MTCVEKEILQQVRELQPVSLIRLGLTCRREQIFARMVREGLVVEAGKGMLGTNWRAAR